MPRVNGAHTVSHCRCTGAHLVAGVPREMLKPYGFVSTPTLVIADAEWKVRERYDTGLSRRVTLTLAIVNLRAFSAHGTAEE
jgi:hypothetical protein